MPVHSHHDHAMDARLRATDGCPVDQLDSTRQIGLGRGFPTVRFTWLLRAAKRVWRLHGHLAGIPAFTGTLALRT